MPRTITETVEALSASCLPCELAQQQSMAADVETEPEQSAKWEGILTFEGQKTGDGRIIETNALRWDTLPVPLRWVGSDVGGHDGAVVVGRITDIERRDNGAIYAIGDFDLGSEMGREAARQVQEGLTPGVSVDLDEVSFEVRVASEASEYLAEDQIEMAAEPDEDGRVKVLSGNPDDELTITTGARIRAATLVAIPAFESARITLTAAVVDSHGSWHNPLNGEYIDMPDKIIDDLFEALSGDTDRLPSEPQSMLNAARVDFQDAARRDFDSPEYGSSVEKGRSKLGVALNGLKRDGTQPDAIPKIEEAQAKIADFVDAREAYLDSPEFGAPDANVPEANAPEGDVTPDVTPDSSVPETKTVDVEEAKSVAADFLKENKLKEWIGPDLKGITDSTVTPDYRNPGAFKITVLGEHRDIGYVLRDPSAPKGGAITVITLGMDGQPIVNRDTAPNAAVRASGEVEEFNWVEDTGTGHLPKYIKRIAKHLEKEGMTKGHAIATAVNAVEKACATGDLNYPGIQHENAGSQAEACEAVAEWEAKKAEAHAKAAEIDPFREVSTEEREKLSEKGNALPDGSFPIANVNDLKNAIQAVGRAKDPEAAKAHIKRRAKELGQDGLIPESWAVLTAGGFPLQPPAAWFSDPKLDGPTPLKVTPEGHVYGHIAVWGTCHTGYPGQCVTPPNSSSNYAYFRTGSVYADDGKEYATGAITMDTLHAGKTLSAASTLAHYENTGHGAADVTVGEDAYGIWISGALRSTVTDEQAKVLRASPLSGDWRRIGGNLELVAALAVNVPGFPIPRPQGLVAGGAMQSLVASGMLAPETPKTRKARRTQRKALSEEDYAYLKRLADRERKMIEDEAAVMAREVAAADLARSIGV